METSHLTSDSTERKRLTGFYNLKRLRNPLFNRAKVMKFLNEYFFGFTEEELNDYRKSREHTKDLDQL